MSTLKQFVVFRWLSGIMAEHKIRKQRKRIEYCERQWDRKLRGLRR